MTRIIERKEVHFYRTDEGHCPFHEWLDSLDKRAQAVVESRLGRLETGNPGVVESVGEGVHELKIDFGPGYRIYFGNVHGRLVVILAGGAKRYQSQDIAVARSYWRIFKAGAQTGVD